ncbi:MAG: hypothetical protein ACREHC_04315 [Candidatus Levyibacteriota bacterium]
MPKKTLRKKALPVKKKKAAKKKFQLGSVGSLFVVGVVTMMVGAGAVTVGGVVPNSKSTGTQQVQIVTPTPEYNKPNLQLETFGYTTVTPTVPAPSITQITTTTTTNTSCGPEDDNGVLVTEACECMDLTVICKGGVATNPDGTTFTIPKGDAPEGFEPGQNPCGTKIAPADGRYCVAKPVIYLYPTIPTSVNVQVITSGTIVVSDPHYPQGGWQNVLAYPNGNLTYNGKQYAELFYESSVTDFQKPDKGIIIAKNQLPEKLSSILDQLGLINNEKQEFLDFWLPKLQNLPSPYIYFSLLDTSAKAQVDKVTISPKPDTEIAFIAYFKPVSSATYGSVLHLPTKPQRVGFVSVEWGGTIDTK